MGLVVAALLYSFFSGLEAAAWVFSAVIIGSFLPDLDLDEGIPFQMLFGLLGATVAGTVFFNLQQSGEYGLKGIAIFSVLTFTAVRFGIGSIFKNFTHHRGVLHSIPVAAIAGLSTVWLLDIFSLAGKIRIFVGVGITVGYLGHLILDELYASVDFRGHSFLPSKSLGSALKLWSGSAFATLLAYAVIVFMFLKLPEVGEFFAHFWVK